MECIRRNGHDFVPVKIMLAWGCRIAFFTALGFGMGAVAIIPWLAKTSVWQSARAEKLAENILDQAARCEGRMMVMEKACPLRVRARAAVQNIGGEEQ